MTEATRQLIIDLTAMRERIAKMRSETIERSVQPGAWNGKDLEMHRAENLFHAGRNIDTAIGHLSNELSK